MLTATTSTRGTNMFLRGKRIFMVEDNIGNRAIIQLILERDGAKVAIDRWGMDTLKRIKEFMPLDLIILDLMLPGGLSGYDLFTRIREVPEFKHIPILAVSAANPPQAIPECQEHGFSGFIGKPVDFVLFASQVAQVIAGEEVWYSHSGA